MLTRTSSGATLQIYGGDAPHIGCVLLCQPRMSLTGDGSVSVTSSVINLLSHKDDIIAIPAAEGLCKHINQPVACSAGVHLDGAGEDEIMQLVENTKKAMSILLSSV